MATIQAKTSRGHKYWYIVESRRVNGKPRPIVLAYLGKADDLLVRLQGLTEALRLKSYSHGAVAALVKVAHELDVCHTINRYIHSPKDYVADQPIRHQLTAGITFLLAAIGQVCMPTSKRGWWNWAKTTSLEYLLRCRLSPIDSQHFWDLMDALPVASIAEIEADILNKAFTRYRLDSESLFFDTTHFFTYLDTTNTHCTLAQRGKNKQKRHDLRQIGLAMGVTRHDMIPLFHLTYQGNLHDTQVFRQLIVALKTRIKARGLDGEKHTVVFDRGNNSKTNLALLKEAQLHYVGALTPYHHRALVNQAMRHFRALSWDNGVTLQVYRDQCDIWGEERTLIVTISEPLKAGQLRGLYQGLDKAEKQLNELQQQLEHPRAKKRDQEKLKDKIKKMLAAQFVKSIIQWSLNEQSAGKFRLHYAINPDALYEIEARMGFRIIMSDRHDWATQEIITTYQGQAQVEQAFKNLKNPYPLAIRPQFHWTDQKIHAHYFICVLGYLLSTLVWREVKHQCGFQGTLDNLLDLLNGVRLATLLEASTRRGKVKAQYKLEEMTDQETQIIRALGIEDIHRQRPKLRGVGVYT